MTDNDRPADSPPPPEYQIIECREAANVKAPLDQFADLVFSAENALMQMKFGWEHPADVLAGLKELQGQALHDIPQFFPDHPPLAVEIAEAADAWLTYWGHNTINLEAVRALKDEDDHA